MPSEHGRSGRSTTAWALPAAALLLAGCGSSGSEPSPTPPPSASSPLPAECLAQDAGRACITQIAAQVQRRAILLADGTTVTHEDVLDAVKPMAEAVGEIPTGAGYELGSELGDADTLATATTPLLMSWQVGTVTQNLWACFHDGSATVSAAPCQG